jgi:hypothetical protein
MKYTLILAADPAEAPAPGSPEEGRFSRRSSPSTKRSRTRGSTWRGAAAGRLHGDHDPGGGRPTDRHDGPFAETKEQIGGFFLLECADLDEALSWAAKVPTAALGYGAVEVRPCIDYTQAMG